MDEDESWSGGIEGSGEVWGEVVGVGEIVGVCDEGFVLEFLHLFFFLGQLLFD